MPKKLNPRGKAATPPPVQDPPVAPKKTAKKTGTRRRSTHKPETYFARNLWNSEVRITLTGASDERKLELRPRGQRGDMERVSLDEWEDSYMDKQLVERLTEDEAQVVMEGQMTNQQAPHAALEALRDEYGRPIERVVTTIPSSQAGQVVGEISQGPATPRLDQTEVIMRPSGAAPVQANVPGGQEPAQNYRTIQIPANIPPEQQADYIAKHANPQKGEAAATQAAESLRNSLNVRMAPAQRVVERKPGGQQ